MSLCISHEASELSPYGPSMYLGSAPDIVSTDLKKQPLDYIASL
jgi:hypothetical protein